MKSMRTVSRAPTALTLLLLAVAGLLSVATSRGVTHDPVYLSWEAFRSAVTVTAPRAIERRGKILTHGHWLVVSEPQRGLHLFDNRDPAHPRAVAFVRVPGNVDLAARGTTLYADSFVDLLVFELTDTAPHLRLVRRVKDVFPYDPYQALPERQRIFPAPVDRDRGVVVAWVPRRGQGGRR